MILLYIYNYIYISYVICIYIYISYISIDYFTVKASHGFQLLSGFPSDQSIDHITYCPSNSHAEPISLI